MIQVKSLTKQFGATLAVDDISFTVNKGEILGFLGPNGAGKSTTMRMITGVIPPTRGECTVCGFDVVSQPIEAKSRIGYLPEGIALYDEMNVGVYLAYAAEAKGIERANRKREVGNVLDVCGIADISKRVIGNLSKGYRQRVGLAQALIGDPEVLILDEPTVGLDPQQIIQIRQTIKSMRGDRTIILSTHILHEVTNICSHIAIINEGKLYAFDTIDKLDASARQGSMLECEIKGDCERATRCLSELKNVREVTLRNAVDRDAGVFRYSVLVESDTDPREAIVSMLHDKGLRLLELHWAKSSLEETFLRIISED